MSIASCPCGKPAVVAAHGTPKCLRCAGAFRTRPFIAPVGTLIEHTSHLTEKGCPNLRERSAATWDESYLALTVACMKTLSR